MAVMVVIGTLAGMGTLSYLNYIEKARITKAIADIATLGREIQSYAINTGSLPDTLVDIEKDQLLDPWGKPYQYLNFENIAGKGKMRKDRFLVPLNDNFDLYSMGEDGHSMPPLTAKASHDDVIWASNGEYIGLASNY